MRRGGLSDDDAFYNRDYVPIDILPSDVGGGKSAPPMASSFFGKISNNEINLKQYNEFHHSTQKGSIKDRDYA